MPACPHCGRELKHLLHTQSGLIVTKYDGRKEAYVRHEYDKSFVMYECPGCYKVVATTPRGAEAFFKGRSVAEGFGLKEVD